MDEEAGVVEPVAVKDLGGGRAGSGKGGERPKPLPGKAGSAGREVGNQKLVSYIIRKQN